MPESVFQDLALGIIPAGNTVNEHVTSDSAIPVSIAATGGGGAPPVDYHNAVWNTTNGEWIRWVTQDAPDPGGASYPGPGTFGVDTQATALVEYVD